MRAARHAAVWLAASVAAVSCKRAQPPPAAAPERPEGRAAREPLQPHRSDERCIAPIDAPASHLVARPAAGKITLGVVAGLKNASEENLAQLQGLVAQLKAQGAELIIADGDVGDTSDEQKVLLGALTQAGLPIVVVPGNRETRGDLDSAESDLRNRGAVVYDLSHTRVIDLGDALLVGLPGTFDRRQLHTDGACVYSQRDVDLLGSFLDRLPPGTPPALLVAAVPPRGQDPRALDVSEGQNVGDARLNALLLARRAPFGIFGQAWESGGRGIDGSGRPVAQEAPSEQLYLNPGAADHTAWPMSDGTTSTGSAALLVVQGRRASYRVLRPAAAARGKSSG